MNPLPCNESYDIDDEHFGQNGEKYMARPTEIPSFRPSIQWYEDWPFGADTLVQLEARITGTAADSAVNAFLEPLTQDAHSDRANGSRFYYWGGFTVESAALIDE